MQAEELAASTNSPDYAAKMLGYSRKTFGNMIHAMKDENDLKRGLTERYLARQRRCLLSTV